MKKCLLFFILTALLFNGCGDNAVKDDEVIDDGGNTSQVYVTSVAVSADVTPVRILKLSDNPAEQDPAEHRRQLTAYISPPSLAEEFKEVEWESLDTAVATVDQNGLVTAVGEGEVQIKVTTKTMRANNTPAVAYCAVKVRETDPALFRWVADKDPAFADLPINDPRTINWLGNTTGSTIMAMGKAAIASTSKSGKKGYLLNYFDPALYPRDPETGLYSDTLSLEDRTFLRNGNTRLIIGCTDFGNYDEDETGNWVYTNLTNPNYCPEGTLNLYQAVTISIEFSDQTAGIGDSASGYAIEPTQGWQVFILNNNTALAQSVVSGSRWLSEAPAYSEGSDGIMSRTYNGVNATSNTVSALELQGFLKKGFISIHSGYGRQLVVRSIVIEPVDW